MSDYPTWLNGWRRSPGSWVLESVTLDGSGWKLCTVPMSWLLQNKRLFEPSSRPFTRMRSRSFHLRVPDLTQLSPLLDPGSLLTKFIPPARETRHAIFVIEGTDEEPRVYVPAALLMRELWMWNPSAAHALFTPNSLAMYLGPSRTEEEGQVTVSGPLARAGSSDTGLRRLSWLAQCADAQASWASALTFAHDGALRLRLPCAGLEAWAWGIELPTGMLVAELSSVSLSFALPVEGCRVQLGMAINQCPPAPKRRRGKARF